jgi:Protein of unknown function (DUF1592)/Protein of unknown function (DUF1588)/Protein of unknown function (DUF1585)/Protein of unknown function (DUF1587)/Protein of unknown function (DUF1595)/Planctomycete cytochrome C
MIVMNAIMPTISATLLTLALSSPQAPPVGQEVLDQYCITCHNDRARTGGLALDTHDLDNVAEAPEVWEMVVRKLRGGMMPPAGARRPERAVLDDFAEDVEGRLDAAWARNPNPGAPGLHRLNRTEYANAIRDLLALKIDVTTLLPSDDASEGFDNVADSLGISPSLVQGYVSSAMKISRFAVGDMTLLPYRTDYTVPQNLLQNRHLEGLPLGTLGGLVVEHAFPLDAEYQISGGGGSLLMIDGEPVQSGGGGRGGFGRGGRGASRIFVSAGPHTLTSAVVETRRTGGVDGIYSAPVTARGVTGISINGPFDATGPGTTPSRERIFICRPTTPDQELPCAREILSSLAERAFRQPVSEAEIDNLIRFYEEGKAEGGGDFEIGIQHGLARILVAPKFLYRFESQPANVGEGEIYQLSDLELASRLSFFLWSSIPDDELRSLAIGGRLSDADVYRQQVRRMLADPKSGALIDNFASQWLSLRELAQVTPEKGDWDDNLRYSFTEETRLLFRDIMREDRSVVDLLDPDYTWVDERLAEHYGIPEIRGSYFRKIELPPDSPRRGLLGQGSVLTATSIPNRTSPVVRGKWVLENVLGVPAPEPPPGVNTNLDPDPEINESSSLRQRLESHRSNPVCASCHQIMDPIGLSLEHFDLTGQWRDLDDGVSIDASGVLVDGTRINGSIDLRKALLTRSDTFVRTMTEKMLMYAVGRPVEYYDMPTVRAIVRAAGENDYHFSTIVMGIAESPAFRMRAARAEASE